MSLRGYEHRPRSTPLSPAARRLTAADSAASATCDGTAVGVIVHHAAEKRFLVFRTPHPTMVEPLTLHHRGNTSARQAAHDALERCELSISAMHEITAVSCPDRCPQAPGASHGGHGWVVLLAVATGPIEPFSHPTHQPTWVPRASVQELAERTRDLAIRKIRLPDFLDRPGLSPVWLRLLRTALVIDLPDGDLAAVDALVPSLAPLPAAA
jgi:hypothetical protein